LSFERVNIEFHASANFRDLITQVQAANRQLGTLQNSLNLSSAKGIGDSVKAFEDAIKLSGMYSVSTADVTSAEKAFGKQLAENKLRLNDYTRTLREHYRQRAAGTSMISRLARQQLLTERAIVLEAGRNADGSIKATSLRPTALSNDLETKVAIKRKEMQLLNTAIQQGSTKLIDWGKNTQWAGRQIMVGITIPLGIFGAAAGKAFYELDKGLTRMVKVYGDLGTKLSDGQVAKLREDVTGLARVLAQDYGASLEQTIGLAGDFAAVGQQGKDLLTSTTEATRLAILGEVDRQDAMKTTLALTSAFQVKTEDLADAVNFLNAVENQTSLSLQDLTVAIPKAGPLIRNLGGDYQDLALYLTAMKEGGVNAGEGANAIKSSLSSLIAPTKAATEYLADLGVNIVGIRDANKGDITQYILDLKAALDELDPTDRQAALVKLFGKYQVSRLTALFDNIGRVGSQTNKVLDLTKASTEALGDIAEREIKQVTQSLSGQWNRAVETFKISLASVGEEFLRIGIFMVNLGTKVLDFWSNLPDTLKGAIAIFLGLVGTIGVVMMSLGVFANLIGTAVKGIMLLRRFVDWRRGQVTFWEYLNEQMHVNNQLGDRMTAVLKDQTLATKVFAGEVKILVAALEKLYTTQMSSVNGSRAGIRMMQALEAERAAMATTGDSVQLGHVMPSNLITGRDLLGPGASKNWSFLYGLPFAPETLASNQGTIDTARKTQAASIYATGDNLKAFDPMVAVRAAAGQSAIQSILGGRNTGFDKIRAKYEAAERLFFAGKMEKASLAFQDFMSNSVIRGEQVGVMFEREFGKFFNTYQTLYKEIGALDPKSDAFKARLKAASGQLVDDKGKLVNNYKQLMDAIEAGLIDGQTTLFQIESSIEAQKILRPGQAPRISKSGQGGKGKFETIGYGAGNLYAGDARVADQVGDIQMSLLDDLDEQERVIVQSVENTEAEKEVQKERAKVVEKERKTLKQRMSKVGKYGGIAAMGAMTALPFMTETGNASLDNTVNVAGGASMGAMMGMMAGPWGAAIGGVIGGLIPGIQLLIDKAGEFGRVTEAAFSVGSDAAERYGLKLRDLNDITIAQREGGVNGGRVSEIAQSIMNQDESSPDRILAEFIRSEENMGNVFGRLSQRAAMLAISGANPEQIKEQISALLVAAGKTDQIIQINAALDLNFNKDKKGNFTGTAENVRKLVQGQINDAMSKLSTNETQDLVNKAFGDKAGAIGEAIKKGLFEFGGATPADIKDFIPSPTAEQINAWKQYEFAIRAAGPAAEAFAMTEETKAAFDEISKTLSQAAATMPIDKFWELADSLDYSKLSASQFANSIRDVYGASSPMSQALLQMADVGYTTQQMLQGIALVNAGVISSWQSLQSMGPAYLDVIYRTFAAKQEFGASVGKKLTDEANDKQTAGINPNGSPIGGSGVKSSGDGGASASDALNKKKKAIQDYYDKEIEKIKESEEAKKKAFEAEQRRLERQKRDMQTMISYREALAAGDFAAAAKAQIQLESDRKKDALEDQQRDEESAVAKRIKALEDERDKKIDAIDKALDAARAADKAAAGSAAGAAVSAGKSWTTVIDEINAAVSTLPTNFEGSMAKLVQIAKTNGLSVGKTIKSSLESAFGDTGTKIFDIIKGDISKAPWSMIGEVVEAAMAKDQNLLNKRINRLKAYITAGGGAAGAAAVAKQSKLVDDPRAGYSFGGAIRGPGSGTSDSIPAWLSNGEYVIRAAAVRKYGLGFMDKLNDMKVARFANGGAAIGNYTWKKAFATALFSTGGYAGAGMYANGGAIAPSIGHYGNITVEVNVTEPGCTADEIVDAAIRKLERRQRRVGANR
jgi:TP901 family phage tail tape measure protein